MSAWTNPWVVAGAVATPWLLWRAWRRLQLSMAKHPSVRGHAKMSRRIARLVPSYTLDDRAFFRSDDCPPETETRRKQGFFALSERLQRDRDLTRAASAALSPGLADAAFTTAYRVPFPFRTLVAQHLVTTEVVDASAGAQLRDLDGNWRYDLSGSYGVNVLGYDAYKTMIRRGTERATELGPVLGAYHPIVLDNVRRLQAISEQDEVSFHMSGTEAVMQAVRLARYHTGRRRAVRFCGAYHGWWDGVQPGVGNPRKVHDVYTLTEMSERTLRVLSTRRDIACVLVNPLQAFHPNGNAPGDGTLMMGRNGIAYDGERYREWLQKLRAVCTERNIVLILDDVFLGFRLAYGGTQEYFGVQGDLVTYGKTLGGGLPVGVVCGRSDLMKRFRDDRPADICFARGTFNAHPYVMATMNEFLRHLDDPAVRSSLYDGQEELQNRRVRQINDRLADEQIPIRVTNMLSIWTTLYLEPGRYHWMFQFYLRAQGLHLSWVGTGRFIFSHALQDDDFDEIAKRFVAAARAMQEDGWLWSPTDARRSLRRRVVREFLAAKFRPGRRNPAAGASVDSVAALPSNAPREQALSSDTRVG